MKGQTLGAAIKLLIFATVTVVAAAILGVVISNRTFGATNTYHAEFKDVTDLLTGNDVRMAGVRVGTVKSIKVADEGRQNVADVEFTVDRNVPMTSSTVVAVRYLNLVGQRYIALIETPGSGQRQDPKALIPLARTRAAIDLTALFNGFKPLFQALTPQDVNKFALEVIRTLQGEGGTVQSLLTQTASLTNTIADRDAVVGHVVHNLLTVLNTVEQRNQGLSSTIDQLQRLVTGLAGDRNAIAASLNHIDALANSSSSFVSGIRPYLPSDLKSLRHLAHNLNTTKDKNGQNTLNGILQREPAKLNRIIRTATYGGYFNFWVCEIGVKNVPSNLNPAPSTAPSCPAAS